MSEDSRMADVLGRCAVLGLPMAALGALAQVGPIAGILVGGGGGIAWALAVPSLQRKVGWIAPLGPIALLVLLATIARPGLPSESLAGVAALAVLAAGAPRMARSSSLGPRLAALVLPALALGIALGASVAFPVGQQSIGFAVLFLVGALVALGWALGRPESLPLPSNS
jgi:hypothetical protein